VKKTFTITSELVLACYHYLREKIDAERFESFSLNCPVAKVVAPEIQGVVSVDGDQVCIGETRHSLYHALDPSRKIRPFVNQFDSAVRESAPSKLPLEDFTFDLDIPDNFLAGRPMTV